MIHQFSLKVCDRVGRAPWRTHPESWILSPRAHALSHLFCSRFVQKQRQKHKTKTCTYSTVLCPCSNMPSLFVSEFCRKTKTKTNSLKVKVPARGLNCVRAQLLTIFAPLLPTLWRSFDYFLRYFCQSDEWVIFPSIFINPAPHICAAYVCGDVMWVFLTATSIYSNYSGWLDSYVCL